MDFSILNVLANITITAMIIVVWKLAAHQMTNLNIVFRGLKDVIFKFLVFFFELFGC